MDREIQRPRTGFAENFAEKLDVLAVEIEKMRIADYVTLLENPRRLLWLNFWAGVARGLGMAIGFTILGAIALILLRELVVLNLPLIGGFIAEVVQMVQTHLKM
ncbi:MAG: DUF5665 domain-containing protein [Heliobacteriaceae bacterium]|nr:DUF5665 domain-containing protein [Heliobacteriaceae bacterium]MDD4587467.1 DUF5665 domain-containing protein [Heliobacteriaceae bacterium]